MIRDSQLNGAASTFYRQCTAIIIAVDILDNQSHAQL